MKTELRPCDVNGVLYDEDGTTTVRMEGCLFHGFITCTDRRGERQITQALVEAKDGHVYRVEPTRVQFTDRSAT
jgi:hypothetical protein